MRFTKAEIAAIPKNIFVPNVLMKAYTRELETLICDETEITEQVLASNLDEAFELAGKVSMGGGTRLFVALGTMCGVSSVTIQSWSKGNGVPDNALRRRVVLLELCTYLTRLYL